MELSIISLHVCFCISLSGPLSVCTIFLHTVNVLIFQIFYSILFWPKFCLCIFFSKILSGMANSVDLNQTAPKGAV